MKTLPNIPSELIILAVKDLEACEKDSNYEIDMSTWHNYDTEKQMCCICLAGAVLAQTLKADFTVTLNPAYMTIFDYPKLMALDSFRQGHVISGFTWLGIEYCYDQLETVVITPYDQNPTSFKADMRELAKILASHGF